MNRIVNHLTTYAYTLHGHRSEVSSHRTFPASFFAQSAKIQLKRNIVAGNYTPCKLELP